jgi:hypothetical protein
MALVRTHLRVTPVATGQQEAGAERTWGLAGRGKFSSLAPMDIAEVEVARPVPLVGRRVLLEGSYAFAVAAHRLGACRRRVCSRAVGHVSVGEVGAAGGWRVFSLMVQA